MGALEDDDETEDEPGDWMMMNVMKQGMADARSKRSFPKHPRANKEG